MTKTELLNNAIKNGYVKEYYSGYLIYPQKCMNTFTLDALLHSLKNEFDFIKISNTIQAIPKVTKR